MQYKRRLTVVFRERLFLSKNKISTYSHSNNRLSGKTPIVRNLFDVGLP